jgi:HSP20 family protein
MTGATTEPGEQPEDPDHYLKRRERMSSSLARRPQGPLAELMDWLENEGPLNPKKIGAAPAVPVEDFVEDGKYVVRAELPGIDPDKDVTVTLDDDLLIIKGERREEKRDKNRQEMRYGSFTRTVRIPSVPAPNRSRRPATTGSSRCGPRSRARKQHHGPSRSSAARNAGREQA